MVFYVVAFFLLPVLGAIYTLVKILVLQISAMKRTGSIEKPLLNPYLKIFFISLGILYGVGLLSVMGYAFTLPKGHPPPFWFILIAIIAFVPYLACVYGIAYGLGPAVAASGIHSKRMFNTIFGNKNKKKMYNNTIHKDSQKQTDFHP